ncbi:trypsin-like peptidase domain-containing protein [Streptomyces sp. YGL11-2]|uniref:nSTAND1 domain-containing NTPase n=1 Tax=Streptomyces sp. YGL11-2 TaxID=3414028 RepID=UPI003CF2CEA5
MPKAREPLNMGGAGILDFAVLRIADQRGICWGAGFLVADRTAVTCAHVVSAALGTPEEQPPDDAARLLVSVPLSSGPVIGGDGVPARIVHFAADDDVAVLQLEEAIPHGRPVTLVDAADVWGHPARIFGFPQGRPAGVWHAGVLRSRQSEGRIQTDLASDGYRVSGGFSGSPVWDEDLAAVIGMVAVAESGEPSASYLIPTDVLLRSWEPLRALTQPVSPFRGLAPFQEADAASFHGREEESDELTARIAAERQVCLVGPSGSGKSSLALAGVVPRLRAQGFSVGVLRPASGNRPLSALAATLLPLLEPDLTAVERLDKLPSMVRVLSRHGVADSVAAIGERHGTRGLLLVVDQFEELLVLAPDKVGELADALYTADLPPTLHVLTTLRADFLEAALAHQQVGAILRNRLYALSAPSPQQLRAIVTAPVSTLPGIAYEPGLVERVLSDAGEEPGALPLLGFTLDRLWHSQRSGFLTHEAYQALGGVAGAVGHHAERLWNAHVPEPAVPAAHHLFASLVRVPLTASAVTRRTALRSELNAESWDIAQAFTDARLLVTNRSPEGVETVEAAHEALISGWRRLADWVEEDRAFLAWRETLRHDHERWDSNGRTPDLLPTRTALESAERWLQDRGTFLTQTEKDYLRRGKEHRHARKRQRRALVTTLTFLTVLALLLGSLFAYYRYVSGQRAAESTSRALAQRSADISPSDPVLSVMTALASYRTSPTDQARDALLRAQLAYPADQRMLSGSDGSVRGLAASEDGEVVLVHSQAGKPTLYVHAATGTVRGQRLDLPYQAAIDFVSQDGHRAGFFTENRDVVWFDVQRDGPSGHLIGPAHHLPARLGPPSGLSNISGDAAISRDGRIVVLTGAGSTSVVWWDLERGGWGKVPLPSGLSATTSFDAVRIAPDGRTLLAAVFDSETKKSSLLAIDREVHHTQTLMPAGAHFTVSDAGGAVASCESATAKGKHTLVIRSTSHPTIIGRYTSSGLADDEDCGLRAIDDNGRWAVTQKESVSLLDLQNNRCPFTEPGGHYDETINKIVLPHGKPAILASTQKRVFYVPPLPQSPPLNPLPQPKLSPNGTSVVGLSNDGKYIERRTADDQGSVLAKAQRKQEDFESQKSKLGFSADGKTVADQTGKRTVVLRRSSDLEPVRTITAADPPTDSEGEPDFRFSFDGDSVVTRSGTVVQRWDRNTADKTAQLDLRQVIHDLPPHPDIEFAPYPQPDDIAVVVWGDPYVHIIDIAARRETRKIRTGPDTANVQFDRTGEHFALLRRGKNIELWQSNPPSKRIGPLFTSDKDDQEFTTGFLPSGQFLTAAGTSVRFYDIEAGQAQDAYTFGTSKNLDSAGYSYVSASADGRTILFRDNELSSPYHIIRLNPDDWMHDLCRQIGYREFTSDERASIGTSIPDELLCHGE